MQFQLYACENIKILLPPFTLLPFHLHEYLLHGFVYRYRDHYYAFIINLLLINNEFMTKCNFNFLRGVGRTFSEILFVLLNKFYF